MFEAAGIGEALIGQQALVAQNAMATTGGVMISIGMVLGFGVLILFSLFLSVLWLWLFIDCIANEPSQGGDKVLWIILFLVFGAWTGPLYLLIRRPKRIMYQGH